MTRAEASREARSISTWCLGLKAVVVHLSTRQYYPLSWDKLDYAAHIHPPEIVEVWREGVEQTRYHAEDK